MRASSFSTISVLRQGPTRYPQMCAMLVARVQLVRMRLSACPHLLPAIYRHRLWFTRRPADRRSIQCRDCLQVRGRVRSLVVIVLLLFMSRATARARGFRSSTLCETAKAHSCGVIPHSSHVEATFSVV